MFVSLPSPAAAALTARVIGGKPAMGSSVGTAIVGIVASNAASPWAGHTCGGVLVAPQVVLTARHCVDSSPYITMPRDYDVVLGLGPTFDLRKRWAGTQRTRVLSIHRSPGLNLSAQQSGWDLALLRLETPLAGATTLPFAHPGDEAWWGATTARTSGVHIFGWGARTDADESKGTDPSNFPVQLQTADLPTVTPDTCAANAQFPASARKFICAGATRHTSTLVRSGCVGDSGGPLVATDPSADPADQAAAVKIVGVVSFGEHAECGEEYGRYVRVSDYAWWIDSFIAATTPVPSGVGAPIVAKSTFSAGKTHLRMASTGGADARRLLVLAEPVGESTGHVIEAVRVPVSPQVAVPLPPSRSGRLAVRVRALDSVGNESVSSPRFRVRTKIDRMAPRLGAVTVRALGRGYWRLSWARPVDNDRVIALAVQRRKLGATRWVYDAVEFDCDDCWVNAKSRLQRSGIVSERPGSWQFRLIPIDRALNFGTPVVAR
ncbi:MAG: peptidase and chymotrypsin/Hap [Thermoleophilia bacterium]|nr:peptidase and chymotrypsin/Hap [Thermoleophilia bacterium]